MQKSEATFVNGKLKFTLSDYTLDTFDVVRYGISKQEIMEEAACILEEHDLGLDSLDEKIFDSAYKKVVGRLDLINEQVELIGVCDILAQRLEQAVPQQVIDSHIESNVRMLDEVLTSEYKEALWQLMDRDIDGFDNFIREYTKKNLERIYATEALAEYLQLEKMDEEESLKLFEDDLSTYVFPCFAYSEDAVDDAWRLISVRHLMSGATINHIQETKDEAKKRFLQFKARQSTESLTFEDIERAADYLVI